jgi:hypothetical protein
MIKTSIALAVVAALAHSVVPHDTIAAWHAQAHEYLQQQHADKDLQETPNVAGTWNISLHGHQVALVLEQEGRTITGTLMIMGKDVAVDGTFSDRVLSLTGADAVDHAGQETVPMKLTATLKDDGTLDGEISTARGPMKWTAERLKGTK